MKRRILATVQALVVSCALLTACSKSGAALSAPEAAQQRQRTARVGDEKPVTPNYAPMPVDSLQLDSLNRPGFH